MRTETMSQSSAPLEGADRTRRPVETSAIDDKTNPPSGPSLIPGAIYRVRHEPKAPRSELPGHFDILAPGGDSIGTVWDDDGALAQLVCAAINTHAAAMRPIAGAA